MKRGAERQLSKDDGEDDNEVEEVSGPMQKASETALAGRKIRGLPKRAGMTAEPSPPPSTNGATTADSKPKFAGFGGFWAPSSGNSAFTFGAPTLGTTANTQPSTKPSIPSASVAPTASNATKSFASLINPSSAPSAPKPVNGTTSSSTSETDSAALKYFSSLRGLNTSLMSTLSKAIETDPFLDIGSLLEQYRQHRITVQAEFDNANEPSPTPPEDIPAPSSTPPATSTMPTPPASFAGPFKFEPPSSKPPPSTSGGFTPTFSASTASTGKSGGFSFPPSASSGLFGASTADAPSTLADKPSAPVNSFMPPPKAEDSKPKEEQTSKATEPPKLAPAPAAFGGFGGGGFGSAFVTPRTSTLFGSSATSKPADAAEEKKDEKPKPAFTFGSSTSTSSPFGTSPFGAGATASPFGASTAFGTGSNAPVDKDKPALTFGSGSLTPPKGGLFTFGAAATKAGEASPPAVKTPPVGFQFGPPPPKFELKPPATTDGQPSAGPSTESTPAPEGEEAAPLPNMFGQGLYDKEGSGEEDEDTTHEVKSKVFRLSKDNEGTASWNELGVGMLRLKKHRKTDKRRLFLRNGSTGKIVLNFNIYAALNPSQSQKTLSFIGHDDQGEKVTYRVRVGSEQAAGSLKDALSREIEFVKSTQPE